MKKNYVSLIVYALILGMIIGLPFALVEWNGLLVQDTYTLVFYIISKALFGLLFICLAVYGFVKEMARGMYFYSMAATLFLQLIPIAVRSGVYMNQFKYAFSPLLVGVVLILYVIFLGALFRTNRYHLESDKKYEGKTIDIKEER